MSMVRSIQDIVVPMRMVLYDAFAFEGFHQRLQTQIPSRHLLRIPVRAPEAVR